MFTMLVNGFFIRRKVKFEELDGSEIMRARYMLASIGESLTKASNDASKWTETLSDRVESEIVSILRNGAYDDSALEVLVRKAIPQADETFVSHVVLPRMAKEGLVVKTKARIDVDGTRTRTHNVYSLF